MDSHVQQIKLLQGASASHLKTGNNGIYLDYSEFCETWHTPTTFLSLSLAFAALCKTGVTTISACQSSTCPPKASFSATLRVRTLHPDVPSPLRPLIAPCLYHSYSNLQRFVDLSGHFLPGTFAHLFPPGHPACFIQLC